MLLKAVARLALPADQQLEYLRRLGEPVSVDELALEYHDLVPLISQFAENEWIGGRDLDILVAIDNKLEAMSGDRNRHMWTQRAVHEAPEWGELRNIAQLFIMS